MRKLLVIALVMFAVGVGFGLTSDPVAAKGGGGSTSCYYYCTCDGTPMKCCVYSGVTYCFPTDEFQCPQIYNC